MTAFVGRASGKVILFGEHAVVYGVPGVAAGIDRGALATATVTGGLGSVLTLGGQRFTDGGEEDLARAFSALLAIADPGVKLEVDARADIPPGGGLGCSAALGVAVARAVEAASGGHGDVIGRVAARATAWEGVFHGNPSGIDTAAAIAGSFLWFERGIGTSLIASPSDVWIAIGYSGASASTKTMVEGIARIKEKNPPLFEKFLEGVRSISNNAKLAIDAGDAHALGKLMDMNQMLLAGVMLSTEPIEAMIASARQGGAFGAKLTGSGGGGSVIALGGMCPRGQQGSDAEVLAKRIAESWSAAGYPSFPTRICGSSSGRSDPRSGAPAEQKN